MVSYTKSTFCPKYIYKQPTLILHISPPKATYPDIHTSNAEKHIQSIINLIPGG